MNIMNVGFIISSFCKNKKDLKVCKFCIESIRKHYPNNKIIIINDYSLIDITEINDNYSNITIVMSSIKGGGDMACYEFFLENKPFDTAVIMNDSMFLENKIKNINKIKSIIPLWHATNHIIEWDFIKEPLSEYNRLNNIVTHSDNIIHHIKKYLNNTDFGNYALKIYKQKEMWSVFFCLTMIINYDFLKELNEKTNILYLLKQLNTNRKRRISESVFPIACSYLLGDSIKETSLNGLYYSGPINLGGKGIPIENLHGNNVPYKEISEYKYCVKGKYISKISLNRRR